MYTTFCQYFLEWKIFQGGYKKKVLDGTYAELENDWTFFPCALYNKAATPRSQGDVKKKNGCVFVALIFSFVFRTRVTISR